MAYPFPDDRLPSFAIFKAMVPLVVLPVADLIPTQYVVRIDRLQWLHAGNTPEGEDFPHVVTWQGKTYLYDGHHRHIIALLHGKSDMAARNYVMHDRPNCIVGPSGSGSYEEALACSCASCISWLKFRYGCETAYRGAVREPSIESKVAEAL